MARNKTLLSLLQDYRAEARISGNPAHNSGAVQSQVNLLQRTQETLWEMHDWPHLRVERFIDLQAGQRFYDPLSAANADDTVTGDVPIDRVEMIEVRYGQEWLKLHDGIDASHHAQWDSYEDQRSWPVERWAIYEDDQIEVWPIPSTDGDRHTAPTATTLEGRLRLTGIRSLHSLVADDDRADLDDRLIVLYAAAETLGSKGAEDAARKLQLAEKQYKSLIGNTSKVKSFKLFGVGVKPKPHRPYIPTVHYRDRET